jgi:hypothetical protein
VLLIKAFLEGIKKDAKTIAKGFTETFRETLLGLIEIAPTLIDVRLELLLELAYALPELLTSLVDSAFTIIVKLLSTCQTLGGRCEDRAGALNDSLAYDLDFRIRSIMHRIAVEQILKPML